MKVVHLITDLDVGGAEMMLARLLETIDRGRVESTVISLSAKGAIGDRIEQSGIPVFALGMKPGRGNPFALWRLVRLLGQLRPDLIQTWLYHADLAGLLAGALVRTPVVWNIRCAELNRRDHPRALSLLLKVLALTSHRPVAVIANSASGRRAHEALGYAPRRWEIIHNGFDVEAFRPCPNARADVRRALGVAEDARLVGLLARLHPMKDHAAFLEAAAIVTRREQDVHFVAAGRDVAGDRVLADTIRRLEVGARVHLLPEQSDPASFLAALDVAVSSSYGEAFPNVVAEAMACGTLCVATAVGDSAEIVGDAGALVPPRDPEALAAAVLRFLALDPEARHRLSVAARDRIRTRFSLQSAAERYERLYLELAGHRAGPAGTSICVG